MSILEPKCKLLKTNRLEFFDSYNGSIKINLLFENEPLGVIFYFLSYAYAGDRFRNCHKSFSELV